MLTLNSRYDVKLEGMCTSYRLLHCSHSCVCAVIKGANLVVPSHRIPTGIYVFISTVYGQWRTPIQIVTANHSVHWNESLIIQGRPLTFLQWLIPVLPDTSTTLQVEIRASFETEMVGRGDLIGKFDTTLEKLLVHDEQFGESLPTPSICISSSTAGQKYHSRLLKSGVHHFC